MTTASTLAGLWCSPALTGLFWAGRLWWPVDGWKLLLERVLQVVAAAPGRRHWPSNAHPRGWPVGSDALMPPLRQVLAIVSDRGQHCGQPTAALLEQGALVIPRGAVAACAASLLVG